MNLLRLAAIYILLLAASAATDAQTDNEISVAGQAESERERGWASGIERGSSTIQAQANAVFAALRRVESAGSEATADTVEVANLETGSLGLRDGNGSAGCIFMETPGSRIRRWRCYYPNEGEQALNEYQFSEEIRLMRQQQSQLEMLQQQTVIGAISQ